MRRAEDSNGRLAASEATPSLGDLVRRYGGLVFSSALLPHARGDARGALASDDPRLERPVQDVRLHSGSVHPGDLFAALPGLRADGTRFSADAASRGAAMILIPASRSLARVRELLRAAPAARRASPLIWLHPRARAILGELAADVYGRPGERLALSAVTGTNGKTSVCHLAAQLLASAELAPATLGTAGHTLRGASGGALHLEATHTTPDATELQRLLARHLTGGGDCAVMEASSHALVQGRLDGLKLRAAAFTNLTREHLDYHGTMAKYAEAKARLWDHVRPGGTAVVFDSGDVARDMARRAADRGLRVVRVAIEGQGEDGASGGAAWADQEDVLVASQLRASGRGALFVLDGLGIEGAEVHLPLRGSHNVE
ncbi:MAG: Mur ligase family protein, partial [Planctomycetota bacterium]